MSITWAEARKDICRTFFGFYDFSTTVNIAAGNLITSASLADEFVDQGFFNTWFLEFIGGNNTARKNLRVVDYYPEPDTDAPPEVPHGGTLQTAGAALVAEAGAVQFVLMKFRPSDVLGAFNDALRDLYPTIGKIVDDREY